MWSDSAATATPWPPAPGRVAAINSRPDSGCLPLSSTTRKAWPRSSASPHLLPRLLRIPAGLLPARLRPWVTALRTSIEAERRPFPDIAPNTLGEIAEAVPAQEIIVFDYIDARGTSTQRRIEAHRQVHIDRRWYVFGWDLNREDLACLPHRPRQEHPPRGTPLSAQNTANGFGARISARWAG